MSRASLVLASDHACLDARPIRLKLSATMLFFEDLLSDKLIGSTDLDCVIGASHSASHGQLTVYRYVLPASCLARLTSGKGGRQPAHLTFTLFDPSEAENWARTINGMCSRPYFGSDLEGGTSKKRRFLVVINPKAGRGSALKLWETAVSPMLVQGNVDFTVKVTTGPSHARLYVHAFEWTAYEGVLALGGDGTLAEVVNGLCSRDDGERALARLVLIPVGGGTGNGLVKSVVFASDVEYSPVNAVFCALKGVPQQLDLSLVQTPSNSYRSFLLLGWGLISDIDILSESMRWMGEARLTVAALYFIAQHRMYRGRLSILRAASGRVAPSSIPSLGNPLSEDWDVIEGDFSAVFILQTSHCALSMHSGPGVRLDDGLFTIQVVQSATRLQLLHMLLSIDTGEHVNSSVVKQYKAHAYRLEPLTEGRLTLDGELVEYGPIQGLIMGTKATTFRLDTSASRV